MRYIEKMKQMKPYIHRNSIIKPFFLLIFFFGVLSCKVNKENIQNKISSLLLKNIQEQNSKSSVAPEPINLANMDLKDAKALYFGKKKDLSQIQEKFFKITLKDEIIEVELRDKEGKKIEIQLPKPKRILNISENYFLLNFEGLNYWTYIVNPSTGKVFEYHSVYNIGDADLGDEIYNVQNDQLGNIYFLNRVKGNDKWVIDSVVKINIQNPKEIKVQVPIPLNQNVYFFSTDNAGNLAYHAEELTTKLSINMYLKKDSTTPASLKGIENPMDMWKGLDNQVYYCDDKGNIYKINFGKDPQLYGSFGSALCFSDRNGYFLEELVFKDRIIRIPTRLLENKKIALALNSKKPILLEVYNENTKKPRLIDLGNDFGNDLTYYYLGASDNYYYLRVEKENTSYTNSSFVLKINPENDSSTKIITKIYSLSFYGRW